MVISSAGQGARYRDTPEKVWDEEKHVLCIGVLPFQAQGDGTCGATSWKPVKDLVRSCMLRTAGDEPHVQIESQYQDQFLPWAFVTLKKEENAKRVFDQIAGNTWYGTVLMVVWFFFSPKPPQGLSLVRIGDGLKHPKALEVHSQIRDRRLLRRNPANSDRGRESLSNNNTMRIAVMNMMSNLGAPKVEPYSHPMDAQIRMSDPAYHTMIPQPWSSNRIDNQTYTNHNGRSLDQAHGQWIVAPPNTMSDSIPYTLMTGFNMATSAYPMVMSPMAFITADNGDFINSTRYSNMNVDVSIGQSQPVKSTRDSSTKNKPKNDSTPEKDTYHPPVIVDGSKSSSH